MRIDEPESHSLQNFSNAYKWVQWQAPSLSRLALLGDKMAIDIQVAYRAWYRQMLNPVLQENFVKAVNDYALREHEISSQIELRSKFGHKLPEKLQ